MTDKIKTMVQKHPNTPGDDGWYISIHPSLVKSLGWDKYGTLVFTETIDNKLVVEVAEDEQQ
ncbi:MAG: hypothetical protein MK369_08745 [SAR202 cluster bacterium]|nr:hypothetical protein [SAR202 cluster bacterium]